MDLDDERAVLHAWQAYLSEQLAFPFQAEVAEFQEYGRFRQGDEVRVAEVDEHYGLIAKVRHARRRHNLPLADLAASDADSPNYQPLRAYSFWFANR